MELDEMKQVWQRMEGLMAEQTALARASRIDTELGRVRSSLRPLYWGQVVQIVFGICVTVLAVSYWSGNMDVWYRLVTGIVVHVYGVMTIVLAGLTLSKIRGLDYSAPVLVIQERLAELRSLYLFNGAMVGLPWWILWVLFVAIMAGLSGNDLFVTAPGMVFGSIAVGITGLAATWMFHRWAHHPARAKLGKRLDEGAAGSGLERARKILEEVRAFGQE